MNRHSHVQHTLNKQEQQFGGGSVATSPSTFRQRDEHFAADYLGVSVATMRRWRLFGAGPRYRKIGGSVRYDINDLENFLNSCPSGGGKVGVR